MSKELRRSKAHRPPDDALLLAELRKLGVNVDAFLLAALQAEKYVHAHAEADLSELIRRDCLAAPSVLLALRLLRVFGRDDAALRRAGEALGTPSRARKGLLSLKRLEHLEKLAHYWAAADDVTKLSAWRDRVARSAGFASGASLLRQLQTARKKHRTKISPSTRL